MDDYFDEQEEMGEGMDCSGIFSPGTEECDWCPLYDECLMGAE